MTAASTTAWQIQSLLLSYPDETLGERIPLLRNAISSLPAQMGQPLRTFADYAGSTPLLDLQARYVAAFDHHKRLSPYLTYFTQGDTRNRGMALLRLKNAYRSAGLVLGEDELPDHLSVLLEFAATRPAEGQRLLDEFRPALELLRAGLHDAESPWAQVLDSVSATLPRLDSRHHQKISQLAAAGPPVETVGLPPFTPPARTCDGELRS